MGEIERLASYESSFLLLAGVCGNGLSNKLEPSRVRLKLMPDLRINGENLQFRTRAFSWVSINPISKIFLF